MLQIYKKFEKNNALTALFSNLAHFFVNLAQKCHLKYSYSGWIEKKIETRIIASLYFPF